MKKIEIEIPDGKRAEWVDGVLTLVDDVKISTESIHDYLSALGYLGDCMTNNLVGIRENHFEALAALHQLFVIAEAWNKIDGFVPDFSNRNQWKYFPLFTYEDDAARFVFKKVNYTAPDANAYFGSRLCFKTEKRAEQFGKQFAELYNKVFL